MCACGTWVASPPFASWHIKHYDLHEGLYTSFSVTFRRFFFGRSSCVTSASLSSSTGSWSVLSISIGCFPQFDTIFRRRCLQWNAMWLIVVIPFWKKKQFNTLNENSKQIRFYLAKMSLKKKQKKQKIPPLWLLTQEVDLRHAAMMLAAVHDVFCLVQSCLPKKHKYKKQKKIIRPNILQYRGANKRIFSSMEVGVWTTCVWQLLSPKIHSNY